MAFVHGKGTVILGQDFALTGYLTQVQTSKEMQTPDVTTFGNDDKVFIAGIEEGSLSVNGVFDRLTIDAELDSYLATASGQVMSVGVAGDTIGDRAWLAQVRQASYNINSAPNDAVRLAATFTADGGVRAGYFLHALGAETGTGNYSSVDTNATTTFGGVGHLHVTAFSGTNCTIKIQDSANNSTWADLITFSTVSGVTQQRSTSSGTVDRYLRAAITAGTFSSVTFAVTFARNLHA